MENEIRERTNGEVDEGEGNWLFIKEPETEVCMTSEIAAWLVLCPTKRYCLALCLERIIPDSQLCKSCRFRNAAYIAYGIHCARGDCTHYCTSAYQSW